MSAHFKCNPALSMSVQQSVRDSIGWTDFEFGFSKIQYLPWDYIKTIQVCYRKFWGWGLIVVVILNIWYFNFPFLWLNSFPVIIFIILVSIKKILVVSFEKNHPRGDHPVNNISTHLLLSLMHNVRLFFKCLLLQP